MTIIHAYLRKAPITVDLFDTVIEFKPNDKGHVIADVSEKRIASRLLEIAEAYTVHGAAPAEASEAGTGIDTSPYILTQEGDDGREVTIDLRTLDKQALHKFAEDNEVEPLPAKNAKVETMRDAIVAFFKVD